MTHGDDQGLILPPRLAPHQAVIVPIYRSDTERGPVLEAAERARKALAMTEVRVKVDAREDLTPGFKFNDWELRGVPLRIEIGPKDVAKGTVALARRDQPGKKAGKIIVPEAGLAAAVSEMLGAIHSALYARALAFRNEHTHVPQTYAEFKEAVERGWALSWWCGVRECEAQIKADSKVTTRCIPLEQPGGEGVCIHCGERAREKAIFGKSY